MGDVNRVFLKGRLTRNPEMRQTPSGSPVCDFSLATNRYINGEQKTTFHRCTCLNKTAEWLTGEKGGRVGDTLFVEGNMTNDDFELTRGDPSTRTSGRMKVDNCIIEILARRRPKAVEVNNTDIEVQVEKEDNF